MKHFDFVEFFHDSLNGMTNEQRGQFITILCEYYFNGKTKFADMDKTVIGAANMAINYNRKQANNKVIDIETFKNWSSTILTWCKDNNKIKDIKKLTIVTGFNGVQEEVEKKFPDIPSEQVVKILTWIRDKYDEKYYL